MFMLRIKEQKALKVIKAVKRIRKSKIAIDPEKEVVKDIGLIKTKPLEKG